MNWPATIANTAWVAGCLPAWARFRRTLHRPADAQWDLLRRLLARHANSAYGRAHGFGGVTSYDDFARRVPLVDHEDLAPWIERIRGGESRVLTEDRVTHLIPTSGSSGARKLIPFTAGLQRQFNRAIGPWIADLARQRPDVLWGPAYWSITPATPHEDQQRAAVPVGFDDDASYLGGVKGWLVRAALVRPDGGNGWNGLEDFQCRTLLGLLRQGDLRLISVWHPSFLTLLMESLPRHWDGILGQLRLHNRRRAHELERADPDRPATLWPRLRVISCWGDHHAEWPMTVLRRRFPGVLVQPKGLLATEAFVTIPFAGSHPVAVRSHFFEFLDERGSLRRVHELREEAKYEVVVTTAGGLWRCRLHDRVQVDGFVGRTPSLRFVGRGNLVSDRCGEKLSEAFVALVIRELCASTGGEAPRFAMLAPDEHAAGWCYTLYLEGTVRGGWSESLDAALRRNPQYALCRDLGQLQPARVFRISRGGDEAFAQRLAAEGWRLGEIKPASLSLHSGWTSTFPGAYVGEVTTPERGLEPAGV